MSAIPIKKTSHTEIVHQWDRIAETRSKQIRNGVDITFNYVLRPLVIKLLAERATGRILDAGCGVGALTTKLAEGAESVVGIDPSDVNISIAKSECAVSNVDFQCATMEQYAEENGRCEPKFDAVVANMVLMDALDLRAFASACSGVLRSGGVMVFTITHPRWWPYYAGYADAPWFSYKKNIIIEDEFRISLQNDLPIRTVHVHRPIHYYQRVLASAGIPVEHLSDVFPEPEIMALYPSSWKWPRYLAGICKKVG